MRPWKLLLSLALLASPALAGKPLSIVSEGPASGPAGANWSPARATGKPDATPNQDHINAWATLAADAGAEWLELTYPRPVSVAEVHIHQNLNPGAVVRIEVLPESGGAVTVWQGRDRARANILRQRLDKVVKGRRVRLHLDTALVAGWNEIDAVAIVGADMTLQWATEATASSSYAHAGAGPFAAVLGKRVRLTHVQGVIVGRLVAIRGPLFEVQAEASGRTIYVGVNALVTLEVL